MDLPTCPSCGQSVLDDDATECPFCGASMSGAPAAKPKPAAAKAASSTSAAAARSAKPTAAAAKPGVKSPSARTAAAKPADDDPFSVDTSAAERAIPLRPRPVKGATHKITCPMCETAGYAPTTAAGQEVRCANPKCLVPIFTAPALPKEEPVAEEPKMSTGMKVVYGALALLLLAGVAAGAWVMFGQPETPPPPQRRDYTGIRRNNATNDVTQTEDDAKTKESVEPQPKPLTDEEIRQAALTLMVETSRQTAENRSKPYCRRLTAEAYAIAGNMAEARQQLEQLQVVGPQLPYYKIPPLAIIAWQDLAANRAAEAKATVDQAWEAGQNLPNFGRDPLDIAQTLAAALAGSGRRDDAAGLIRNQQQAPEIAQLSMQIQAVRAFDTFDLDEQLAAEAIFPVASPTWSAVVVNLAGRGRWDEALAWAESHSDVPARTDAVIVWAENAALRGPAAASLEPLAAPARKLDAGGRAKLYARVAVRLQMAGRSSEAEQALALAKTALAEVTPPEPLVLPDMKRLYNLTLPESAPLRTAALAAAESARVEAQLGRHDAAAKSLELAMQFARGIAPSPESVADPLQDVEKSASLVREQLRAALELKSEDEIRRALNTYRKQVQTVAEAADARFRLQTAILSEAGTWSGEMAQAVWTEAQARAQESNLDRREPWFRTAVPAILAEQFRKARNADRAAEIDAAIAANNTPADPQFTLEQELETLLAGGKLDEAAARIEAAKVDKNWKYRLGLRTACRIAKQRKFEPAFQFVRRFRDPILREEAFELTGALAARRGEGQAVWDIVQKGPAVPPTEKVGLCRGLIGGLAVAGKAAETQTALR